MTKVSLIPIDRDGTPRGYSGSLPEVAREVCRATAEQYARAGFEEPWIGYLALVDESVVGTCGYKARPRDGRVEIAYFTFPELEGRGHASAMSARLVAIAREHDPSVVVAAQTLPQRNASHRVLEKIGFQHVDTIDHPEDGMVWEWQLGGKKDTNTNVVRPMSPFGWNAGGWFGAQLGSTLWLLILGIVEIRVDLAAGTVVLLCFALANLWGLALWRRRRRLSAYSGLQCMMVVLLVMFAAVVLISNACVPSITLPYWAMAVPLPLMAFFWVRQHPARPPNKA